MNIPKSSYLLINPKKYRSLAKLLLPKLSTLLGNRVTFKNEIHRGSEFAIGNFDIKQNEGLYTLDYDEAQSIITSNQKKTNSDPKSLDSPIVKKILTCFLTDINDDTLVRAEVKLIQTQTFPFKFNPHRDSQFRRLRHITYLATVILDAGGISGGNMQLFHSDNDKLGPFNLIEELPVEPGIGYIVDENPQLIFHGMKTAIQTEEKGHRSALLVRFFNT
ncbi:hypothetical protein DID80_05090, partial [Candidatus Marinamargulisbacteria bacterium SCGC AAA071-K20]